MRVEYAARRRGHFQFGMRISSALPASKPMDEDFRVH
jgi:hypothetical protein